MNSLSSSIVDGSRFKTKQEDWKTKIIRIGRRLAGCLGSLPPQTLQEELALPVRASAGRVTLRQRVDSATFCSPCQGHDSMDVSFL